MSFRYVALMTLLACNFVISHSAAPSTCSYTPVVAVKDDDLSKPYVDGAKILLDGIIQPWSGEIQDVTSPILDQNMLKRMVIGRIAIMNETSVLQVAENAKVAWNAGRGEWPRMSAEERIVAILNVVVELKKRREEIINVLMWEIGKTTTDATSEFDRTMAFIEASVEAYRAMNSVGGSWRTVSGVLAAIRRSAIGIMLCLGPFNYPFNETYAALIPALLLGNVVIMKIPMLGGLAHFLTMEIFAKALPKGVMTFVSGSGRSTVGPLMRSGMLDILSFIGSSATADALLEQHPAPHRLKVFLQLEGKNLGIVTADADVDVAVEQTLLGSTSFNGQRCTAIKLVFLHSSLVDSFLPKFCAAVSALRAGLPWEEGVAITPLPELAKIDFLKALIADAENKGASVVNAAEGGGTVFGSLMRPAVVFPVTSDMRLWREEQFGPVIPIAVYDDVHEVFDFLSKSPHGLQAALFTQSTDTAATVVDALATAVGRVNINTQCARSPDAFPFSARKSSGLGTMSVTDALETFSIEVVVAMKANELNSRIAVDLSSHSVFLNNTNQGKT